MKRRRFLNTSITAALAASLPVSQAMAAALAAMSEVSGDVNAVTGDGAQVTLEKAAVQELSDSLRGRLLLPGFDGYETARRVLNASIDRHPALIVQPSGAADIMQAVTFARERELLLAVKCGGHSYGGKSTCDGGLQLDLSTFRSARVDPASRTAYVAGGSLLGELDHEAMAHGLVTTAGTVSHTGVGGLTLGGGFGRLARRYGLALDNVKAFEIVTADGQLRRASRTENPDLYWALRGGGGNFGVVTSFEFALHPMRREVVSGDAIFPLAKMRDVLAVYADIVQDSPDELYVDFMATSPLGKPDGMCMLHACWSGEHSEAEKALAPIRKIGGAIQENFRAVDYVAVQRAWDDSDPRNTGTYLKSGFINEFPDSLVDALAQNFESFEDRGTTVFFQHSGGAIGRVAADATAFAHRKSVANMFATVEWPLSEPSEPFIGYGRAAWKNYAPYTDGWYTNEVDKHSSQAVNSNYQGNYQRLVQVKNRYDPTNLFRLNANVKPTA
ncbi:MAG: FAD-binding oxidoreductase [Xanthomonadales bacterium]|nr:FAD-binding oxidoreductase [Xanthomonadales bacterium]